MSRIRSQDAKYVCEGHGFLFSEPCDGHTVTVEACLSSDTVSIYLDGQSALVLSDRAYACLEKAINDLSVKWKS